MNFTLAESMWMIFICASILSNFDYYVFSSNQNIDEWDRWSSIPYFYWIFKNTVLLVNLNMQSILYVFMLFEQNHSQILFALWVVKSRILSKTVLCGIDICTLNSLYYFWLSTLAGKSTE